jgi:hypothetical protein
MRSSRALIRAGTALGLLSASLALPPSAAAHAHVPLGDYSLTIGWVNEPTYVGVPNGIEVFIEAGDGQPVTDLAAGDLMVVVSTVDAETAPLPLEPGFSIEGGFGTPGSYEAELMPTTPGDYTFHFTGSIGDQPVDLELTSGEDTFSTVQSSSEIEFPVKVPTLADVATRLDRIDGRIEALQSAAPGAAQIAAAQAAADRASASASQALVIGLLVGGAGIVIGLAALAIAWRGRRGTGTA